VLFRSADLSSRFYNKNFGGRDDDFSQSGHG
jgi:hypothetical protein